MKMKKILTSICATAASAAMVFSAMPISSFAAQPPRQYSDGAHNCVFVTDEETGLSYWYENDARQGVEGDKKNLWLDGTPRGREICDMATKAWYWLDVVRDGAKATSKEVCIPYIFQNDDELRANPDMLAAKGAATDAQSGTEGLGAFLIECVNRGEGKWVRYDANGKMIKGWYTEDGSINPDQKGNTYFYDVQTGLMAKGWITINGERHHFNETTGVLDDGTGGGSNGGGNSSISGWTKDPADVSDIKAAPGMFAIESDVYLSGSGNGYHAKLAISNGASATISFGIQYDANSGKDFARGKCALMIEDATPSEQHYPFPKESEGGIIVGEATGAAHLMLNVDHTNGNYYCFYNGELVYTGNNSGMINGDIQTTNYQIKAEGAADDGSTVVAKFRNTKVKYNYHGLPRIGIRGAGRTYSFTDGGRSFSSGQGDDNGGVCPWASETPELYKSSIITGRNDDLDWDVPSGVQSYINFVEGSGYGTPCVQWDKYVYNNDKKAYEHTVTKADGSTEIVK